MFAFQNEICSIFYLYFCITYIIEQFVNKLSKLRQILNRRLIQVIDLYCSNISEIQIDNE